MLFLLVAFASGVLTVLAPCILPVLPIIIGGTLQSGRKRNAYLITASLAVSIVLFTLILKFSTLFINIPAETWSVISGGIILAFGITSVFPTLWTNISSRLKLQNTSDHWLEASTHAKGRYSDILLGAALGPVFSSCSPTYFIILATVLPANFGLGLVYLITYSAGLALTLLLISLLGQKFTRKIGWAANPNGVFKKGLGIIFILVGILILTGTDKRIQTAILESGYFNITNLEQKLIEDIQDDIMTDSLELPRYKEIQNPSGYVNTEAFKLADLVGHKVILVDFMTYSCINCIRTFPYLNDWYNKYQDDGLEIVGIHTPEFAFEKNLDNVTAAMDKYGIQFPVVLDNDYGTWQAYENQYWPRKYLIDLNGDIVYDHIGEGDYAETENVIRELLGLEPLDINGVPVTTSRRLSPETYFGAARNTFLVNGTSGQTGTQSLILPDSTPLNRLVLGGDWDLQPEYAQALGQTTIRYKFQAGKVYLVASSTSPLQVLVRLDGAPLPTSLAGADVAFNNDAAHVTIAEERLYELLTSVDTEAHTLELTTEAGLQAYTFTFGQ